MNFADILRLAWRNLREARLRAALTTMGVLVGVAVIVTMISFGLGLQRNAVQRFQRLDLFNEITVSGRDLMSLVSAALNRGAGNRQGGATEDGQSAPAHGGANSAQPDKPERRVLNDAALAEIAQVPGVASIEPTVFFTTFVRAHEQTRAQSIGGALVPNPATRFKTFAAGQMLDATDANEAVVDEDFLKAFGYDKAVDAVGQTFELLAPLEPVRERSPADAMTKQHRADEQDVPSFFGLPLGADESGAGVVGEKRDGGQDNANATDGEAVPVGLSSRRFRIVGVLQAETPEGSGTSKSGGGGRPRFRGLAPAAGIYLPLNVARRESRSQRGSLDAMALQLARASGALGAGDDEGYSSVTVRVTDPAILLDVQQQLRARGFNSFSIVEQLKEVQTFFLIMNSALGLLGGISLLVASFGIANTMIMSILERTREIGIMKAVGAQDREIKLIFFVEAALIGLAGGVLGTLAAWAIDVAANRLAYQFLLRPRGVAYVTFFALPPYLWLGAILFAVVIAVIAALYPAARAAQIDPVKALRHD